jgi:hypothetical protein
MTKVQRIEQIERELELLKQEVKEENEFKFFSQKGDNFFSINSFGDLELASAYLAINLPRINNCYKTKEEAEEARDIAVAKHKLKQIIEWKNDGWKPDWENIYESKYIFYCADKTIKIDNWCAYKAQPNWLYMKDSETAEWVLDNYRDLVEIVIGE